MKSVVTGMYFSAIAAADVNISRAGFARSPGRAPASAALEYMPVSERVSKPERYLDARVRVRRELEESLLTGAAETNPRRIVDLIYAVCEESSWSVEPVDDELKPKIDAFAAETACLLGWACVVCALGVREKSKISIEARRRVFSPFMAHDDYECLSGNFGDMPTLAPLIAAAMLLENERTRLYALLRKAGPAADKSCADARGVPLALRASAGASALALSEFCRRVCGADLMISDDWLDELLISNIAPGVFCDPCGEGVLRAVNGTDMYVMGRVSDDEALKALGAAEFSRDRRPATGLLARMLFDFSREMTLDVRKPRLKYAALSDCALMTASGGGVRAVMQSRGRDAGGFTVCMGETPVLISCADAGLAINGCPQTAPVGVGSCDFDDERCDMMADITRCFPESARARFCQRTLMLERESGLLRNINMIETDAPGYAVLTFVTPFPPAKLENGVRAGIALIEWDVNCEISVTRQPGTPAFESGVYSVALKFALSPGSNLLGLTIERC